MVDINNIVVGVDIGTSNLSVAFCWNGFIKVLEDDNRERITPFYAFFDKHHNCVVGSWAQFKTNKKYNNFGIYEVKRLIGRKYDDAVFQNTIKHLSYKVVDVSNRPVIVLEQPNGDFRKTPVEVLSCVLEKIKTDVIKKLGAVNKIKAVVTVPAHFNMAQREDIWKAATKAGFDVERLLSEPTAVALRYFFLNKKFDKKDYFLVYNLGGGTFDVVIYKMLEKNVQAVAVMGDSCLGGHDFDILILNYVSNILMKKYQFDIKSDKVLFQELRSACELTKIALSTLEEFTIILSSFVPNVRNYEIIIKKKQFEDMINKLLQKTISMIKTCLKDNNLSKSDIKHVILSGGSTRIPKVKKLLSKYFGEEAINKFIYRDETAAEGAALQAAALSTCSKQSITILKIFDITPYSIGIRTCPNMMNTIIKRNTPIPCNKITTYLTMGGYIFSHRLFFDIYEGERIDCRNNRYLITAEIKNITRAHRGKCQIQLMLLIDRSGRLMIFAKEKLRDGVRELKVEVSKIWINENRVKNTLWDAIENKKKDQKYFMFAIHKRYLLNFCQTVIYRIERGGLESRKRSILNFCQTASANASLMELADHRKLKKLIKKVEYVGTPIVLMTRPD